ncbi:hypothetical protein ACFSTD_09300 [Novosphingobium colocasiae]
MAGDDGGKDRDAGSPPAAAAPALLPEDAPAMRGLDEVVPAAMTFRSIQPMDSYQIRIEQRMTIRIAPRGAAPMVPDAFVGLPDMTLAPRYLERKMGKCLSMSAIAGVRPQGGITVCCCFCATARWWRPSSIGRAGRAISIRGSTLQILRTGTCASIATSCCRAAVPTAR